MKILVVEDDNFLRGVLTQKLEKEGLDPIEAMDGTEAIKIAEEQVPNLILLDLILPGVDGFEVLEALKANEKTSKIPVLVLSNLGQKDDVDRAVKLGAEEYLIKAHHTPDEILERIRKILNLEQSQAA